jgi:hypothetical protein
MVASYGTQILSVSLTKRTYSLPSETIASFEAEVGHGRRSGVVAELIDTWLEERRRERLREEIVAGCREMGSEYLAVEQEYHPLEEEVERAAERRAATGRSREGTSRSRGGRRAGR